MYYSLNAIRAFDLAAKHKSFKQAADQLNVTPTAISHQIRRLEEILGSSLFKRKIRAVELTDAGKKLASVTTSSLNELDDVLDEIRLNQQKLTISTTSSFASLCLIPIVNLFLDNHPEIDLSLRTTEDLERMKKDDNIDLAIRFGDLTGVEQQHILLSDPVDIYAASSFPAELANLAGQNLLETQWKNTGLPTVSWRDWVNETDQKGVIRQFEQEHQVIHAALAGQGLALVSSLLVRNFVREGWLKPVTVKDIQPQSPSLGYYLVYPQNIQPNGRVEHFVRWLTAALV
ncbi:LysR substrate-binding domain-containing protein [Neptunicella sp. SCSIO 80796]|uniref:LysR substrate-binding domain-containing protein n=1 Tax=Neptunicella plasticusilytica TaxID=3117012 RepID=UPI003A4D2092